MNIIQLTSICVNIVLVNFYIRRQYNNVFFIFLHKKYFHPEIFRTFFTHFTDLNPSLPKLICVLFTQNLFSGFFCFHFIVQYFSTKFTVGKHNSSFLHTIQVSKENFVFSKLYNRRLL